MTWMDKVKVKKPRKLTNHQIIVNRFVKIEGSVQNKNFWPREIKLARDLLEAYPFDFLKQLREPFSPRKMDSLCWFKTADGQAFLKGEKFLFDGHQKVDITPQKSEIVLQSDKIGEDVVIVKKEPKTLKDFLKLYEQ